MEPPRKVRERVMEKTARIFQVIIEGIIYYKISRDLERAFEVCLVGDHPQGCMIYNWTTEKRSQRLLKDFHKNAPKLGISLETIRTIKTEEVDEIPEGAFPSPRWVTVDGELVRRQAPAYEKKAPKAKKASTPKAKKAPAKKVISLEEHKAKKPAFKKVEKKAEKKEDDFFPTKKEAVVAARKAGYGSRVVEGYKGHWYLRVE